MLSFFAQDSGTRNLVYASADISKTTQHQEVIAFCDHWKAASGSDPEMLAMDQKVTNQAVLGTRGVRFLTRRMRSPALVRHINALKAGRLQDDHAGPARPAQTSTRVHEDKARTPPSPGGTAEACTSSSANSGPKKLHGNRR